LQKSQNSLSGESVHCKVQTTNENDNLTTASNDNL